MIIRRAVALEVDVVTSVVDRRRIRKRQVALARAKLLLVSRRASRQAAGIAEAASAGAQPNAVDREEVRVAVELV